METHSNSPVSADEAFRMIDVGAKVVTARRALAEGWIELSSTVLERVKTRTLPKGDALVLAEVAGILAAKNTSLLIPLCHPLPLDAVLVRCEVHDHGVRVEAEARAHAKTGVEMEALVAVQAALLTIYDLCKGLDPALTLGHIRLVRKEGGKSGLWIHPDRAEHSATPASQARLRP
ncbi:MAG: cyclic pyranopterin monophosphate synthase MoaC, partial [Oligoflexus sp.]